MGKGFGELAYIRGVISYSISPFEQKAFHGLLSKGIPNGLRRVKDAVIRVAPPFLLGYIIYDQVEKEHERMMKKNPQDYINDK